MSGEADVRAVIIDALHEQVDGDFLIGANPWDLDSDLGISDARISDIIRWAADTLTPVLEPYVQQRVAAALEGAVRRLALQSCRDFHHLEPGYVVGCDWCESWAYGIVNGAKS